MNPDFRSTFQPAFLILIPAFQPDNLWDVLYDPFDPSLDSLLSHFLLAFNPCLLQLSS
jgi:hypothetical protein